MMELRHAMTENQIQRLMDGDFDPDETVTITTMRQATRFSEDIARPPIRRKRRGPRVKQPPKPPSEQYGPAYVKWHTKQADCEADAKAVLGCYFTYYLDHFGEEDPEWAGQSCVKPLYNINQMAHAVCGGDFSKLIEFVEEILPLWAEQLRKGVEFPSTRPSVDTLFVRRKIWAQRFNLYRRWKS